MKSSDEQNGERKSFATRLNYLLFIVALSVTTLAIVILRGSSFLENINRLEQRAISVELSNWDIPMFVAIPCFIALTIALILRFIDQDSDSRIRACVNTALVFAMLTIIVRIPCGYIASNFMTNKGYAPCWEFSSPSVMSPVVWVRNSGYCIENSGSVRKELITWLNSLPNKGNNLTPNDIREKVEALLADYDKKEREKFPELFDD